jgi:hypothetical protein
MELKRALTNCLLWENQFYADGVLKIAPRRGLALRDAIINSQPHSSTFLGKAVTKIDRKGDRLIVFTDEQSDDKVSGPTDAATW